MSTTIKSIFKGRIIDLGIETARLPDGRTVELEIVRHPGGAAVVALNGREEVCLVHQYRHAAGGWLWELPAGKIDHGEDPAETARRELREEAGVSARGWESLGTLHSSPGVLAEVIHLYLARGLVQSGQALEEDELLEVHWVPLDRAVAQAVSGEISDAKTLIGLFRAREAVSGGRG